MWRAASMVWVDIMLHRRYVAPVMGLLASSRSFEMQPMHEGEQCGVPEQFKTRLLALQTRQQLSTNALALAAQSERSVLGLIG